MPSVTHLTVRGFKSIAALERFELGSLNVLIGPNGGGKSNLLAVFRMLGAIATDRLQLFVAQQDRPDALLHGGTSLTSQMDIECEFGDQAYAASFTAVGAHLAFTREQTRCGNHFNNLGSGQYESNLDAQDQAEANPTSRFLRKAMSEWRVHHFNQTAINSRMRQAQPVRDNLQLHSDGSNLAPYLRHIRERHPENYREIVEAVRRAAPYIDDFLHRQAPVERVELEWVERGVEAGRTIGPRQLSDGTIRFICLATLLLQPVFMQPSTILIDEPELGLHPYALTLLAEFLQAASASRQVVVSTQSADLVSEFEAKDVILARRQDGCSEFDRVDEHRLREWLEEYSLGDLWRMNVVGASPSR